MSCPTIWLYRFNRRIKSVCTPALNSEIVHKYLERDPDLSRKIIAFCASVEQAQDLNTKFNSVGIISECIIGTTKEQEREPIFEKYANNKIKSLTSVGVLCEGFDSPDVTSVLVCRPVKSKALWVQMNGRGLRISPGKDDCWFLDFCGNFKRLGLPTDSFPLTLCPNNKPFEPTLTKTCYSCGSEIAIYEKICPVCGCIFCTSRKPAKSKRRKFEEILSPEQKVQVRFLRNKAVKLYNQGKPIDKLETIFEKEFGYSAPIDWYDGLIFGQDCDGWEAYVQNYWRFLIKTTPDAGSTTAKNWIRECIQREFKSAIYNAKTNFMRYVASTGNTKEEIEERAEERINKLIGYKTWWAILGLSKPIDAEYLSKAYQDCREHPNFAKIPFKEEIIREELSRNIGAILITQLGRK
jgi:Helicase conserved C-terminal domain